MSMKPFHIMARSAISIAPIAITSRGERYISIGDVIGHEEAGGTPCRRFWWTLKRHTEYILRARLIGRESCPCPKLHLSDVAA